MTRKLYVVEVNREPLDQGGFVEEQDAYQAAEEAKQIVKPTDVVDVVPYVPAVEVN